MFKIKPNKQPYTNWSADKESAEYHEKALYSFMPAPYMLVIDVDIKNDAPGLESFERFRIDTGIKNCWWNVKTGSGGYHYYFYYPTDLPHLRKNQPDYPGLDFLHYKTELCVAGNQVLDNGEYIFNGTKGLQFNNTPDYLSNTKLQFKINLSNRKFIRNGIHKPLLEMCNQFNDSNLTPHQINACLELIDSNDYPIWITIGMILKQHLGEDGFELYDEWSSRSDKYVDSNDVYSHWKTFQIRDVSKDLAVTFGTLVYYALEKKYIRLQLELESCNSKEEVIDIMNKDFYTSYPTFSNQFIFDKIPIFLKTLSVFKKYTKSDLEDLCKEALIKEDINKEEKEEFTSFFKNIIRFVFDNSKNCFYDLEKDAPVDKMYIQTYIYPYKKELAELYKVKNFTVDIAIQLELIKSAVFFDYNPDIKERVYLNSDNALVYNSFKYNTIPSSCSIISSNGWEYISLLKTHSERLLGEEYSKILLSFFAYLVQNPGKKIGWVPVIQGAPGVGKTLLINALARCCLGNANYHSVGCDEITREHTGWAVGKLLVIIPELKIDWKVDKMIMERLKPIITDPYFRYSEKYRVSQNVPNRLNLIATTNYENPIPLDSDDRRYCIMFSKVTSVAEMIESIGIHNHFDKLVYITKCDDALAGEIRKYFLEYPIDPIFTLDKLPELNDNKQSYLQGLISLNSANEYYLELIKAAYKDYFIPYIDSEYLIDYHDNHFNKEDFNFYIRNLSNRKLNSILKTFGYRPYKKWYFFSKINKVEAHKYIDSKMQTSSIEKNEYINTEMHNFELDFLPSF